MLRSIHMWVVRALFIALGLGTAAPASAQDGSLDRAFQKEFAYLKAQKQALAGRLNEINANTQRKTTSAKAEIDRLQGQLVALTMRGDEMEDMLLEAQRNTTTMEDRSDTVVGILEQSKASLAKYDISVGEVPETPEARVAALDKVFGNAARLIGEGGEVRKLEGGFFDQSGKRVEGQVTHIGRIAAYGVSSGSAGALAPAGDGRLKLWPVDSKESAEAITQGTQVDNVGIFLFENLDKPIDEKKGKTWLETIEAGGVIAWVIFVIGLLAFLLIVVRGITLAWVGRRRGKVGDTVVKLVRAGKLEKAAGVAAIAGGPLGRVVVDTLRHIRRPREIVEDIAAEAVLRETPGLERFGNVIMVFAAVSPLLGLLGTVTGMISTFDIITEYGTGDPKMLSGGISEALITTQLGLVVAIPALLFGNLLNSWANSILSDLEHTALRIVNAADTPAPVLDEEPEGEKSDTPVRGRLRMAPGSAA